MNSSKNTSFFRSEIGEMSAYAPGEQPRDRRYIKLNTNENPYPPSPSIASLLGNLDTSRLRLYPDPECHELRKTIGKLHNYSEDEIMAGNGSDDLLTIAVRSFAGQDDCIACFTPTYSLYPVLAKIQGCGCIRIPLDAQNGYQPPEETFKLATSAKLFIVSRPNAPTGTSMPMNFIKELCAKFNGIVLIDEAYADFASDNCIEIPKDFPNAIVMRTLSKSYSLAGIRLGYAIASQEIIRGLMKVKDSYNVNMLTQLIAIEALKDRQHFDGSVSRIRETRRRLLLELRKRNFHVLDSEANFVFASPPDGNAEKLYLQLKEKGVLVRHFRGAETGRFIRITVGTDDEIDSLLSLI